MQLLLRGESETVDRVGSAVGPLTELLRRLGERHVGADHAVDDRLPRERGCQSHKNTALI